MCGRVTSIGHIALLTRDLDRMASFYAEVFEATALERSANDARAGLGFVRIGDSTRLHIFEMRDGPLGGIADDRADRSFQRGRIDHFSLEARDATAFAEIRDRLIARGASDGTVVDFGPLVSVFFTDPDGYQLELSLGKPPDWKPPFELTPFDPRAVR